MDLLLGSEAESAKQANNKTGCKGGNLHEEKLAKSSLSEGLQAHIGGKSPAVGQVGFRPAQR
jgi:hypothetical protein